MGLKGKGFYLWQIKRLAGGDPAGIARLAQSAGLSHVLIKVASGRVGYNFVGGVDLVKPLVAELRARHIGVWGWQYIYGVDPDAEADKAIQRVTQFNLDGFVVNAEAQFTAGGRMEKVAKRYMERLRKGLGKTKIALSTYRYPSVIPSFPFSTFLKYCDIAMPQVYWVGASNPGIQLRRSVTEYRLLKPGCEIVPTGAAYEEYGWKPKPGHITEFLNAAQELGLAAANFWEMYAAQIASNGKLWNAVASFDWPGSPSLATAPPPTSTAVEAPPDSKPNTDIATRYIKALNSGNPNKVAKLYDKKTSQLVKGKKSFKGRSKIYRWYNRLLNRKLPDGNFKLTSLSREGNVVRLKWKANSKKARNLRGLDTIRMSPDNPQLIGLHTTEFRAR